MLLSFFLLAPLLVLAQHDLTLIPLPGPAEIIFPQDASHRPEVIPQALIDDPLVMAYYPDWAADKLAPEDIDFDRFDWIDYAFALPDENFALAWDNPELSPALLKRLVDAAHVAGKHVKLSVGGWTGSKNFSPAVATDSSRHTFVSNIVNAYSLHGLDGIDIDWEYPGQQGDTGNIVSPSDTANFLSFLQLLRAKLPADAKITAATQTVPFAGADTKPLANAAEFANVLDWILLMNYDTWGSSSTPGPNAPLNDMCHNASIPSANAHAGVAAWTAAGFPPSQIVLGVPAYGYLSRSSATSLRNRRSESSIVAINGDGGTDDGQIQFRELVAQGLLQRTSGSSFTSVPDQEQETQYMLSFSPVGISLSSVSVSGSYLDDENSEEDEQQVVFKGLQGFTRYWDACSSTPFLKSESSSQIITYDDPESLQLKGEWAKQAGILGLNMFDVHGDTEEWDLVDGLRKGLGL